MDRRSRAILALALTAAFAPATRAQVIVDSPGRGLLEPVSIPREVALGSCVDPLPAPHAADLTDVGCSVTDVIELGEVSGVAWTAVQALRPAIGTWSEPGDSVALDALVLYSADADDASALRRRWHGVTERTYWFIRDVAGVLRPEGLVIEVLSCLNGTGGCGREYLLARGGALDVIEQPYVEELRAGLAPGRRLHKGMTLDLETLTGAWPVALPDDANCCPSEMVTFRVALDGTRLVLVRP